MQTITSGTTTERIVRTVLLILLVVLFAAAYIWDGYVGYARQNGAELARVLGVDPATIPPAYSELTRTRGTVIAGLLAGGGTLSAVAPALGAPTIRHGRDDYYLGPAGWLRIGRDGTRITAATWTDGKRTESDQQWQRWIGYTLGLLGVILILQLLRVLNTRATLSDAGLQVRGKELIPWEAIVDLRADTSGRRGRVELAYSLDRRAGLIRLDAYVYKDLPAIVAAICQRKGFTIGDHTHSVE